MTSPRHRLGRTSLAVAALLAISTLTTIATPATPATAEAERVTPGPTPRDVRTLGDPVAGGFERRAKPARSVCRVGDRALPFVGAAEVLGATVVGLQAAQCQPRRGGGDSGGDRQRLVGRFDAAALLACVDVLIAGRYEQKPTIITSNKSLTEWASIVQDVSLAAAVVDRVLHHGDVFYLRGPSWRVKDRAPEAGISEEAPT